MQEAPSQSRHAAVGDAAEPIVAAAGVSKQYGDTVAVDDLDLEVPAAGIFALVGPSGSGKTTTIRLLTGAARPSSGTVTVFGRPPAGFSPAQRARIGYLPQLSVLFPTMSLRENLTFVASIYGLPLRRGRRLRDALDLVELWDERDRRLRDASGGMQRRLALAAALVHDPELVFLDEPTAGIDPVLRRKLWDRFRELRDEGRTLFVTTQYVSEAEYCDLVAVLHEGRVQTVDTPAGLRRQAFGGDLLEVRTDQAVSEGLVDELHRLEGVVELHAQGSDGRTVWLVVEQADRAIPRITAWLDDHGLTAETVREERPPFDDVFVRLIEEGSA